VSLRTISAPTGSAPPAESLSAAGCWRLALLLAVIRAFTAVFKRSWKVFLAMAGFSSARKKVSKIFIG
jgi:hypothetical protein